MKDFRKLNVWEKAHALSLAVYKITESFPTKVKWMLTGLIKSLKADR